MVKVFQVEGTPRNRRLVPLADARPVEPQPTPPPVDVSHHDLPSAIARRIELDRVLSSTPKHDPARRVLVAEANALAKVLPELKERQKAQNLKKNFAGLMSPLAESIAARLDPELVAELEADALSRLAEREARSAAKKAAKAESTAKTG